MSIFQKSIQPKIDFSTFDLSRNSLIALNFGQLVPCFVQEILPNDHFKVRGASNVQFAPMVAPMMQDVYVSYHYFYVPNRILYKDWESAFSGTQDGRVLSEEDIPEMPHLSQSENRYIFNLNDRAVWANSRNVLSTFNINELPDYLGYPSVLSPVFGNGKLNSFVSDLPFRAYFKIWYDWYRDENLQIRSDFVLPGNSNIYHDLWLNWYGNASSSSMYLCLGSVDKLYNNEGLIPCVKYRAYKKDYFTACLPSPQKGEVVKISLSGDLSVSIPTQNITLNAVTNTIGLAVTNESGVFEEGSNAVYVPGTGIEGGGSLAANNSLITSLTGRNNELTGTASLADATAITINELRTAFALQRILEAMSVGGSRYNEYLLSQYGCAPEDLRLQRPQFLGGWTQKVAVQQVIQTGGDLTNNQFMNQPGYAAGRMFSAGSDFIFSQTFKEPGYIIGIMSVMPKAGYFQGLPKHLTRQHRFDYYNPKFAYLGEQAVLNKELYFQNKDTDNQTFGYMQRWAEYRTSYDTIHGDFKSSLKHYHMYRELNSVPTLSEDFILVKDVDTRPFVLWKNQTDSNGRLIWVNIYHDVKASRPLPYNPMPGIHA